jgi:eukaryotic-like serine/threonine-protein kinase
MVLGKQRLDEAWVEANLSRSRDSRRMTSFHEQIATETLLAQRMIDEGLVHLERALPLIDVTWMDRCPLLAPLRAHSRFAAARAVVSARIDDMWS